MTLAIRDETVLWKKSWRIEVCVEGMVVIVYVRECSISIGVYIEIYNNVIFYFILWLYASGGPWNFTSKKGS